MDTGMNRRHFLSHVAGFSALAVPSLHFLQGLRAAEDKLKKANKSLVILWMGGGPSHMDLWDLKPGAPTGGEFKTRRTKASGVQISEILPTVADQMDKLSVVRALVTNEGSHERGTELMNIGRQPSPIVDYPALGSLASQQLTPKDLPLPGFIDIGGTGQRIGPGFLGMSFAPFTIQNAGQPPQNIRAPASLGSGVEQDARLLRRKGLHEAVENDFSQKVLPHVKAEKDREAAGSAASAHSTIYKKAFDLTVSPLRTVFEVRTESPKVIESYGGMQNQFGMGCLLARKLIEKGVTAVEVSLGGWDNHQNIFPTLRNNLGPRLDKGMGTLVKELSERGLWKNTVVVWMGEFGRTPRINQNAGRDHWGRVWSVVLGGGAIKGGQVYGSTSDDGTDVKDSPASIGDLYATLFQGLGVDPTSQVRDNLGRPLAIADGKPLKGLV